MQYESALSLIDENNQNMYFIEMIHVTSIEDLLLQYLIHKTFNILTCIKSFFRKV